MDRAQGVIFRNFVSNFLMENDSYGGVDCVFLLASAASEYHASGTERFALHARNVTCAWTSQD